MTGGVNVMSNSALPSISVSGFLSVTTIVALDVMLLVPGSVDDPSFGVTLHLKK